MRKLSSKYDVLNIRFITCGSDGSYTAISSGSGFSRSRFTRFRLLNVLTTSDMDHLSWWLFEVRLKLDPSGEKFILDYDLLESYNYYAYPATTLSVDESMCKLYVNCSGNEDGPNIIIAFSN